MSAWSCTNAKVCERTLAKHILCHAADLEHIKLVNTGEAVVKLLINEKEYVIPGCSNLYCRVSEAKQVRFACCSFSMCVDPD